MINRIIWKAVLLLVSIEGIITSVSNMIGAGLTDTTGAYSQYQRMIADVPAQNIGMLIISGVLLLIACCIPTEKDNQDNNEE